MGLEAPSPASLARIFRQEGVARAEPSKRPRAAWRRFVYPAPNACWQLDATEYVLAGGRKGGDLAGSRTTTPAWRWPGWSPRAMAGQAAIDVFDKGAAARGAHPAPARPTTARPRAPAGAQSPAAWWGTCAPRASNPPPAKPLQTHHPRATTSASARLYSATSTSSPRPSPSPTSRPGSTPSTASTTPSAPTRACPGASPRSRPGTPARSPGRPDRATTPTPSPPPTEPARDAPAGRRPPHRRRPIAPSGEREAGHHPQRAPTTSAASRSWSAAPRPGTEPPRSGTPPPSPSPTPTAGILIQYNWPPEGVTRVCHHPPDPTNQRARPRPQQAPTVTEVLTHRTSPMS